jgi:hypothetical protein
VQVVDEEQHAAAGVGLADADVVEPAVVSQGDGAVVDAVASDPVVDRSGVLCWWCGFGAGIEGGRGGAAADGAVGPVVVVGLGEGVELCLQVGEGGGGVLRGEPFLHRLVEPFDLADHVVVEVDVGARPGQDASSVQHHHAPRGTWWLRASTWGGTPRTKRIRASGRR